MQKEYINSIVLIPPSEGKTDGGSLPGLNIQTMGLPSLSKKRRDLIEVLQSTMKSSQNLNKILGVKGVALEKAINDNLAIYDAPTMPAIKRYSGVMFDSIDYEGFGETERQIFDDNVFILSGLFGIISPDENIPNYKLKMGAVLPGLSSCAYEWKPYITKMITEAAKNSIIWDFLPNEHSSAWDERKVKYLKRYTIKFVQNKGGKLKTLSHWSKSLRGAFIQYLFSNNLLQNTSPINDIMSGFSHPADYIYQPTMTSNNGNTLNFVFLKRG
jgi:cytoplasmic iron level regulating protein YaaA (DUF328/UPF0246 family)